MARRWRSRRSSSSGRALLTGPVEVLEGAEEAVIALGRTHRVVLVTKGDLVDQRRKLAASGLAGCFSHVEIVPDKTPGAYDELLRFLDVPAERFLMVGNSEVSDVAAGARARRLGGARAVPHHVGAGAGRGAGRARPAAHRRLAVRGPRPAAGRGPRQASAHCR